MATFGMPTTLRMSGGGRMGRGLMRCSLMSRGMFRRGMLRMLSRLVRGMGRGPRSGMSGMLGCAVGAFRSVIRMLRSVRRTVLVARRTVSGVIGMLRSMRRTVGGVVGTLGGVSSMALGTRGVRLGTVGASGFCDVMPLELARPCGRGDRRPAMILGGTERGVSACSLHMAGLLGGSLRMLFVRGGFLGSIRAGLNAAISAVEACPAGVVEIGRAHV